MRAYMWLLIIAVALGWGGGQGLFSALKQSEPLRMTCAEYEKARPDAIWVELRDCVVDLPDGMFAGTATEPTELFLPVLPADAEEDAKTSLVLVSKDPKLLGLMGEMGKLDAEKDEAKATEWATQHATELFSPRTVTGMVQFGIDLSESDRDQVKNLGDNLKPDFSMLEDGKKPELGFSLAMVGGSFACLVFGVFMFLRGRAPKAATPPAAPATGAAAPPPPGAIGPS